MSSKYGMASAMADVMGGYEKEESRVAGKAAASQQTEIGGLKLDKLRSEAEAEGSKEAIKMMLRGDLQGAMEKYNAQGEDRMQNLQFDPDEGVVSWEDGQGGQQVTMLQHLMASVGLDPKDLETPEGKFGREKEMVEHKARMAKKYGIGKGTGKPTAYIQNLEYTMKKLTGGDARKAFQLMQLSKSDPQTAYSRILIGLQKQNKDLFDDEKMTEEEMRKAAKDSVTGFREEMFDELLGSRKGAEPAPTAAATPAEAAPVFDPNNPSSLWR